MSKLETCSHMIVGTSFQLVQFPTPPSITFLRQKSHKLRVERDLGLPADAGKDQDEAGTSRPAQLDDERQPGERRQRIQSE